MTWWARPESSIGELVQATRPRLNVLLAGGATAWHPGLTDVAR